MKNSVVLLGTGSRGLLVEDAPLMPLFLFVGNVVPGASIWIRQNLMRLVDGVELHGISRQRIVRMVALGKKSVDTLDRLAVGRRTQLQGFVVVDEGGVTHTPMTARPRPSAPASDM